MTYSWTICRRQWWPESTLEERHTSEFRECACMWMKANRSSLAKSTDKWNLRSWGKRPLYLNCRHRHQRHSPVQIPLMGSHERLDAKGFEQNSKEKDLDQCKRDRLYFHFLFAFRNSGGYSAHDPHYIYPCLVVNADNNDDFPSMYVCIASFHGYFVC